MKGCIYSTMMRGELRWVLNVRVGSTRRRFFFRTEAEAQEQMEKLKKEHKSCGDQWLHIDAKAKEELMCARALAIENNVTVLTAVRVYVERYAQKKREEASAGGLNVETALGRFLVERRKHGLSPRTIEKLESSISTFFAGEEKANIVAVANREGIRERLETFENTPRRNDVRATIKQFFEWVIAANPTLIPENPVRLIKPYRISLREREERSKKPVSIFQPERVAEIFRLLHDKRPELLPLTALAFFAGLRPEREASTATWDQMHFKGEPNKHGVINETDYVAVGDWQSKDLTAREVPMEPVLRQWLLWCRERNLPLGQYGAYGLWRSARRHLKISGWQPDIARHTYGSMHLMAFRDQNTTQANMGHTRFTTLANHYRRVIPQSVALTYWQLVPEFVLGGQNEMENERTLRKCLPTLGNA